MALIDDVKIAYRAVARAPLSDAEAAALAAKISAGPLTLDNYIADLTKQVASTTSAAIAIASFITGVTPTSDKLDALKVEADKQVASYTKLGVGNPALGAFEAFGKGFAEDPSTGFATKYGAMSADDFIKAVYASVYGGAPTDAAFSNLSAQIAYFTKLYSDAGLANAALLAKGAALGQIVGYAFVDPVAAEKSKLDDQVNKLLVSAAKGDADVFGKALPSLDPTPPSGPSIDPPQTFELLAGDDKITGGSGDDTIKGKVNINAALTTYDSTDVIDGGAGRDTLAIESNAFSFTVNGGNLHNVERLQIKNTVSGARIDLSSLTGVNEVINKDSTQSLQFNDLPTGVDVTIDGAKGQTTITFDENKLGGTNDALTVNLNNYGSSNSFQNLRIDTINSTSNEFETLNLVATGVNSVRLRTSTNETSLDTLNISGGGDLTLVFQAGANPLGHLWTTLNNIDASKATGKISIGAVISSVPQELGAADHKITLGSGNDTVFFGANLTGGDEVDGGAGVDTISVSAGVDDAALAHVRNIENIRFQLNGADIIQDAGISALNGFNIFIDADISMRSITLQNLSNGARITRDNRLNGSSGLDLIMELKNGSGSADELTFVASSAFFGDRLRDVAGLEKLNIELGVSGVYIDSDEITAKHVLTGNGNIAFGAVAASEIDASAYSGTLSISKFLASAATVKGSSGPDYLNLYDGAHTIDVGAGDDQVKFGTFGANTAPGAARVTLGDGSDLVMLYGNNAAGDGGATSYAAFANIVDFKIDAPGQGDRLGFSANDANFSLTPNNAGAASTGLAKGAVAQGLQPVRNDVIVIQELAKDALPTAAATDVTFFKLTTEVVFTTDIKGTFAAAIGSASVTNLAANGNYLISLYDAANSKMVIGLVNVGGNANGDTTLAANDFSNADIAIVGVLNMSSLDYAAFGMTQFEPIS